MFNTHSHTHSHTGLDGKSMEFFLIGVRNIYTGELQSVDGYMNIALEKTEEYVDGQRRRTYGDAFVRGNNGASYIVTLLANADLGFWA